MESYKSIEGYRLNRIEKESDSVKLFFESPRTNKAYTLSFKGLLFETPNPSLNKRVSYIDLDDTLGYKAISQLQFLKKDRKKYKQLFIQMEGSNDDHKLELLGVGKDYNLLPRRRRPVDKRNIKKITN